MKKPEGNHHPYCEETYGEYQKTKLVDSPSHAVGMNTWVCACSILRAYDEWKLKGRHE